MLCTVQKVSMPTDYSFEMSGVIVVCHRLYQVFPELTELPASFCCNPKTCFLIILKYRLLSLTYLCCNRGFAIMHYMNPWRSHKYWHVQTRLHFIHTELIVSKFLYLASPSNKWFLKIPWVHTSNDTSVRSAVFSIHDPQTDKPSYTVLHKRRKTHGDISFKFYLIFKTSLADFLVNLQ